MSTTVALVVLDSVRTDYFEEYFDWLDGTWFSNAWSTGNYSIPAHGSLFGGRYPSELGVHAKAQTLDCPDPVLAEQFRDAGYRTRAYSANALVGPDLDFDRGFDEFNLRWDLSGTFPSHFSWRTELEESDGPSAYCRALVKCLLDRNTATIPSIRRAFAVHGYNDEGAAEATEFLDSVEFGDKEFLFINLMEAHWPYWGDASFLTYGSNPVNEKPSTVPGGDVDLSAHEAGYEEWISYLAKCYRRIHRRLLKNFDYVVTLADHGDLFGEHGGRAHFYGLFPELVRIPLVIADGVSGKEHRDDVVSIVDVHHTVCSVAGLEPTDRGVDLLTTQQDKPRLTEFHGFRPDRLNALGAKGFDDEEINRYDQYLAGIAMQEDFYGYETPHGFESRGTPDGDPKTALEDLKESLKVRDVSNTPDANLSKETRQELRYLGYLE